MTGPSGLLPPRPRQRARGGRGWELWHPPWSSLPGLSITQGPSEGHSESQFLHLQTGECSHVPPRCRGRAGDLGACAGRTPGRGKWPQQPRGPVGLQPEASSPPLPGYLEAGHPCIWTNRITRASASSSGGFPCCSASPNGWGSRLRTNYFPVTSTRGISLSGRRKSKRQPPANSTAPLWASPGNAPHTRAASCGSFGNVCLRPALRGS